MVTADGQHRRGAARRAREHLADDPELLATSDELAEGLARAADLLDEERGRGGDARPRLGQGVEDEEVPDLAHRGRADRAHALADAREVACGAEEAREPLVLGRLPVTRDVDPRDVEPSARLATTRERPEHHERAPRRDLGVAPVRVVDPEERGDVLDLARDDAPAVARDRLGRALPERRSVRAHAGERSTAEGRQLDREGGDLATLAELRRAIHVDDGDGGLEPLHRAEITP